MSSTDISTLLVILLGILMTTQIHLAKALQRQGIEVYDQILAKVKKTGVQVKGGEKKPIIYSLGLILNHTTFIYHLFVIPLGGTTALYTSMYGTGLVALLVYTSLVMKERISRVELAGAITILVGTLAIGIEGINRPPMDMASMDPEQTLLVVVVFVIGAVLLVVIGLLKGRTRAIGLTFGLSAGVIGCMDPFLKGAGQATGVGLRAVPGSAFGWGFLAASFLIGELAVVITQVGFYRRARANILVPAYDSTYVAVPVLLQAILLPGYRLYWTTLLSLGLIVAGIVLIRAFKTDPETDIQPGDRPAQLEM